MTKLDLAREGKGLDVLYETSDPFGMIELADELLSDGSRLAIWSCKLRDGRAIVTIGTARGGAGGYGAEGQPIVIEAADLPAVIDLVAGVGPELQQEHKAAKVAIVVLACNGNLAASLLRDSERKSRFALTEIEGDRRCAVPVADLDVLWEALVATMDKIAAAAVLQPSGVRVN